MWRWVMRNEVLVFIVLGVILVRIPTLFEPYWYGDEGIYLTIGQALRQGVQLYSGIHDNKPPFLYLIAAVADGYQFWFRFITLVWNTATVAMFWYLVRKWVSSNLQAAWITIVFAVLTNIPLLEGNIANAELYFLLLTITAFYWIYSGRSSFWGGLLLGLGALFKMPAVLEVGIWPLYWLFTRDKAWFSKSFWMGLGVAIPIGLSTAYFAMVGTLQPFLVAAGVQNIPYLSTWAAPMSMAQRGGVALAVLGILFILRKQIGPKVLLVSLWWVFTLFAALLSGRPYPHYLLQMAPAFALGLATLIWGKERERQIVAGLISLVIAAFVIFKFYTYPTISYYTNFFNWATQRQTKWEYFATFSSDVYPNYQLAETIVEGSLPEEKIFIWGDQPMVYALARRQPVGRYTAKYHILDFRAQEETLTKLHQDPPRYIVAFSPTAELEGLDALLSAQYVLVESSTTAQIYRLGL